MIVKYLRFWTLELMYSTEAYSSRIPDAAIIEGRSQEHFQNSHNLIINPQILKFSLFNNKSGVESEISQQSDFHENYENSQKANRAFFCGCIIFIYHKDLKKQECLRNSFDLLGVSPLWHVAQGVSRAPTNNNLSCFSKSLR